MDKEWTLSPLSATSLDNVESHSACQGVIRLSPDDFGTHVAIHQVNLTGEVRSAEPYCSVHAHDHESELNIFLPAPSMEYAVELAGAALTISEPSVVSISPGVPHAANAVSGAGFFICIRIPSG